ncbi:MAG: MogA/MoaB family molybdenum cofactor biosynthesis protein [Candidatus Brocadiaceae bacterium]|jgi:molybdenum cofactor synthesis domain-containing protein
MDFQAAILVASDRIYRGEQEDESGRAAAGLLGDCAQVAELRVVPDERDLIAAALREWSDRGIGLILTIGGTGLSARDVTPEATREVIEREVPGISAALLRQGLSSTPRAMLSRATAGTRKESLIVNLPGSVSAVNELVPYLLQVVPHALDVLRGEPEPYAD